MLNGSTNPHSPAPLSRLAVIALCIAVAIAGAAEIKRWSIDRREARALVSTQAPATGNVKLTKVSETIIPMPPGVPSAHASTMAALPGDARIAYELAGAHDSAGDEEAAVPLYEEALAAGLREPHRHRAQVQLASLLVDQGAGYG